MRTYYRSVVLSSLSVAAGSRPSVNRRVLLVRRPQGIPQAGDFAIDETPVAGPDAGQMLVRNLYLSVDPAQRGWASAAANYSDPVPVGGVMRALAVGEVAASRIEGFAVGDKVYGWFGWQEFAVVTGDAVVTRIDEQQAPLSAFAGPLGINGITAMLAFEGLGRPQSGETVLVSTAAGAVGSVVGQLARAAGCRVLGLTGSADKAARCVDRFRYDRAIDYHVSNLGAAVDALAPDGIDIFFDNVGGATLDAVLRRMKVAGRVIQCGTASVASWEPAPMGPRVEREMLTRRLSWGGFVVFDHQPRFAETIARLAAMIADGRLCYEEDVSDGIEAAPGALAELYAGRNTGKKLIRLSA